MQPATTTYDVDRALMNAGSGSPFGALKVIPLTRNNSPTKRSVLADFTLDPFPGDTPQDFVAASAFVGADGLVHVIGTDVIFVMGAPAVTVSIMGYGLTNTAGTVWVGGALLDTPVPLVFTGDAAEIEPDLAYGF